MMILLSILACGGEPESDVLATCMSEFEWGYWDSGCDWGYPLTREEVEEYAREACEGMGEELTADNAVGAGWNMGWELCERAW